MCKTAIAYDVRIWGKMYITLHLHLHTCTFKRKHLPNEIPRADPKDQENSSDSILSSLSGRIGASLNASV